MSSAKKPGGRRRSAKHAPAKPKRQRSSERFDYPPAPGWLKTYEEGPTTALDELNFLVRTARHELVQWSLVDDGPEQIEVVDDQVSAMYSVEHEMREFISYFDGALSTSEQDPSFESRVAETALNHSMPSARARFVRLRMHVDLVSFLSSESFRQFHRLFPQFLRLAVRLARRAAIGSAEDNVAKRRSIGRDLITGERLTFDFPSDDRVAVRDRLVEYGATEIRRLLAISGDRGRDTQSARNHHAYCLRARRRQEHLDAHKSETEAMQLAKQEVLAMIGDTVDRNYYRIMKNGKSVHRAMFPNIPFCEALPATPAENQ